MTAADTYYPAAAVVRTGSVLFGPYATATLPVGVRDEAETVVLPEPAELARLLSRPRPLARERWVQPALFDVAGVG